MDMLWKPIKVEFVENGGHISMDEDVNEKTPLLPDDITKVQKDKSKMTICQKNQPKVWSWWIIWRVPICHNAVLYKNRSIQTNTVY